MAGLNKVLLIGRLGQEPEKKVTPQGKSVVSLNIATSKSWKDQSGNKQEKTEWHRVIAWDQKADALEKYCKKGSMLYVEGELQTREWQDKDGQKRWTTEIICSQFQFLDSKSQDQGPQQNQNQGGYQQNQNSQNQNKWNQGNDNQSGQGGGQNKPQDFMDDSDIPF